MKTIFTKMHGLGNDFILLNLLDQPSIKYLSESKLPDIAVHLCRRRFGIGADQLLLLTHSDIGDFRMRIYNADGSEVEMCGNGIRCLAKYIWDHGLSRKDTLRIETLAGIITPSKSNGNVRVDMGIPEFHPERIPVNIPDSGGTLYDKGSKFIDYPLEINDRSFEITCLSMGNPHCVIVVDDVDKFPVEQYGPMIENHHLFPRRTNVEFIEILNKKEIKMRVWERGAGETMACGTGASASAVASILKELTEREVTVHLLGGDLSLEWAIDDHVYMTGPATTVFEGTIDLADLIQEKDV
jgi:diaminopimelate epimerase